MRLNTGDLAARVDRLARLGRRRDFSLPAFRRTLDSLVTNGDRGELLRQLLADWTGLPFEADEAQERWSEIEGLIPELREKLGAPLGLQTVLLHHLHSRKGLLKEPRVVSEEHLAVLRVNAITDPLTGLYNRRFLLDHLRARDLARRAHRGDPRRGHDGPEGIQVDQRPARPPVGDSVLVRTARVVRESLRAIDAGCRWGGDEFVLVLPNTDMIAALAVAERVRDRVSSMSLPARGGLALDLHYGVASYPARRQEPGLPAQGRRPAPLPVPLAVAWSGAERRSHPRFARRR
jgi:GGDEF domain-containing protein